MFGKNNNMSKTIVKLNKLKNPESFIQVNTIKGFKYVDKAGEIVNTYHKNNSAPQFQMGLSGLVIEQPKERIDELKITSQVIWARFSKIDSLDMISNLFSKEAESILKILEVEKISRVGWRNYFVHEFLNKGKQEEYLKKFTVIKGTKPSTIRLEVKTSKDFNANLMIQPVIKVIKNDAEKATGILFDIDIFQNGEIEPRNISKLLKEFRQYLADENGFLSVVNNTFE
ncbi:MAG: hypothetical protein AAB740_05230 [Patescibacteria group bacterium]